MVKFNYEDKIIKIFSEIKMWIALLIVRIFGGKQRVEDESR